MDANKKQMLFLLASMYITVQPFKSMCASCTRELAYREKIAHILLYALTPYNHILPAIYNIFSHDCIFWQNMNDIAELLPIYLEIYLKLY